MPIPKEANPTEVTSSNIKTIGYVKKSSTLYVEFKDGNIYRYTGVPETKHNALLAAGSVGKFFFAEVRSKYPYEKVGND